jgi:hypothetical protein
VIKEEPEDEPEEVKVEATDDDDVPLTVKTEKKKKKRKIAGESNEACMYSSLLKSTTGDPTLILL